MPPDQFLPELHLIQKSDGYPFDGVLAEGKLGPDDWVVELCVWVVQHVAGADAAATEMTTSIQGAELFKQDRITRPERRDSQNPPDRRWTLPIATVSKTAMHADNPAFALAIGLIADGRNGPEQMLSWGQTVALKKPLPKSTRKSRPRGATATRRSPVSRRKARAAP